ncbi:hypothetical protein [Alteriqipengyuania lutimaris]|uniref:Uncharacterized protein n=1 Tax=Alteriqipengyuania lutimaris TaxID=1538146 RepID=A0A395LQT6_9SPHN|nr:hypothetical protein [Alteriqipengyuania lutimaris]MBB3034024.1 hypothetical protein [Alteriqipengyuania lutimaris]RDS77030.1 hypothetical protein DL238_04995 [Alteriqipengyuania lutimaris]
MLATISEFPHAGSRGYCVGTADPVTIIRHNADGTALVRREPRAHELRNRDASGNTTIALDDLFATEGEAFDASVARKPKPRRTKRKSRA